MREGTAIIYTLTEYEFLILGSKHPTVLFTDLKPIISTYFKEISKLTFTFDSRKEPCTTRNSQLKYTT